MKKTKLMILSFDGIIQQHSATKTTTIKAAMNDDESNKETNKAQRDEIIYQKLN